MSYVRQPFSWTHEQELDLLELGRDPARMLKGENRGAAAKRAKLIAGRSHRAIEPLLVARHQERATWKGSRYRSRVAGIG